MNRRTEQHMNDELLTLREVADFLRIAPRTIHRYRSAGKFCEPVRLAGQRQTPRWWRSSIVKWANGERIEGRE
ncbi:MAG: helix-turn-helix domain-containing protein [Planctomycetota bacterium]